MKSSSVLCLLATLLLAANVSVATPEQKESPFDAILREVKSLRSMVERLEKRIEMLEKQQSVMPNSVRAGRDDHKIPILKIEEPSERRPFSIEDWHRIEMPWKPHVPYIDKGLYLDR